MVRHEGFGQTTDKIYEVCQRNKFETVSYPGLLQSLSIPTQAWQDLSMDFIKALLDQLAKTPHCDGGSPNKYSHFIPLADPFTAIAIA